MRAFSEAGFRRSVRVLRIVALACPLLVAGCEEASRVPTPGATRESIGTGNAPLAEDGQWTMAAKDYQNSRFSGLSQINTSNVQNLRPAWTFSTGVVRGHEAAPLVVGGTMYLVSPFPNHVFALDLTRAGAPLK